MGGGAGTGASPIDALKLELELANAQKRTPEEARKARGKNAWEALSMTPGPGNVISGMDAKDAYGAALEAAKGGDLKGAGINAGLGTLSALGAVTGLPVGPVARAATKGAKDRLNVFIPVEKGSKKAERAGNMRAEGRENREIWDTTRGVYEPSGQLLEEVPANTMKVRRQHLKPGDETELGKFVEHPALFDRFPQYRHIPVKLTSEMQHVGAHGGGAPVFRTNPDIGGYDVSLAPGGDTRTGLDKLLQYSMNDTARLPVALRHGPDALPTAVNDTVAALQGVNPPDRATSDALKAYLDQITGERDGYMTALAGAAKPIQVETKASNRNAGNMLAKVVRGRAGLSDDKLNTYPYARAAAYMPTNPAARLGKWEDAYALPPPNATPAELEEFIRRWRETGTGKR